MKSKTRIYLAVLLPVYWAQIGCEDTTNIGDPSNSVESRELDERQDADEFYTKATKLLEGEVDLSRKVKAVQWYREAAEKGHVEAQFEFGCLVDSIFDEHITDDTFGEISPEEIIAEAVRWFWKAAEQGHSQAQYKVGEILLYDPSTFEQIRSESGDLGEAVDWFRRSAEQGEGRARSKLIEMLLMGEGTGRDHKEAAMWLRKSAEQGNASDQIRLSILLTLGDGIPNDVDEAAEWFHKGVSACLPDDEHFPPNQIAFGIFERFWEKESDSAKWIRALAEQGEPYAQYVLGSCLKSGFREDFPQDREEAVVWQWKAAEQGYAKSQQLIGDAFYYGSTRGFPKDYKKAAMWYRKASEQGLNTAQFSLGLMYFQGEGVVQDFVEGYKWLNLAVAETEPGFLREEYVKSRDKAAKLMTTEQIAEAQKLSREWKESFQREG